jgi:outer membrane autotransporter protein
MARIAPFKRTLKNSTALITAAIMLAPAGAWAVTNTITTATTTPITLATGDTLTVSSTGSITAAGNTVIASGAPSGFINNSGTINSTGSPNFAGVNITTGLTGGITNSGTIESTGSTGYGIHLQNGATLAGGITNTGTISGSSNGILLNTGSSLTGGITNNGTISGEEAIEANGGTIAGGITNNAGHSITGGDYGIELNAGAALTGGIVNHGTIDGNTSGIYASSSSIDSITNASNGTIESSGDPAIYLVGASTVGTLTNAGTIESTGGTGIAVDGTSHIGTLANTGTITSGSVNSAALYLESNTQGALTNSGTISNTGGGTALDFAVAPTGAFTNASGANITSTTTAGGVTTPHTAVNFGAAATLINNGTITGLVTDGGTAAAITLTNTGTVTGNVSLTGAGVVHTVNLNGGNVTGTYTGGSGVDALTLDGGEIGGVVNLEGGVNTLAVNGNFTTHANILATGGSINTTVASGGTLDVAAGDSVALGTGTLTVNGLAETVGAAATITNSGAVTIGSNGTLFADSTGDSLGAISNSGNLHIGSTSAITATNFTGVASSNSTVTYDLTSNGTTNTVGLLTVNGNPVNFANTIVDINSTTPQTIAAGTSTTGAHNVIATGTGNATGPTSVEDNSYLYNFTVTPVANTLVLSAQQQSISSSTDSQNNQNAANALFTGPNATTTDPDLLAVQNSIAGQSTRQGFNSAVASTEPTVDGGSVIGAFDVTDQSFDLADQQLAMLRPANATTGMAAGDSMWSGNGWNGSGLRTWGQAFGGHTDQDNRGAETGYRDNSVGGSFGADTQNAMDNTIVGVAFTYGHTHVNSNNVNTTDANVNTYQAALYGSHYLDIDHATFLTGMASYGYDRNDQTRHNVGLVNGLDAQGDYNSWQGAARAELGHDFGFRGITLTPTATADYLHYHGNSYSESGAGGADLNVDSADENILNFGVGAQATMLFKNANGSYFKPDIHTSYKYDVLHDDRVDVNSTFAAGGPSFNTEGFNPSNSTYDAGTTLRFYTAGHWEFSGSYDFTYKSEYTANTGMLKAAYKF